MRLYNLYSPGIAIGLVTAMISFFMGGYNIPFALSIFCAQFIGIITAGCTGKIISSNVENRSISNNYFYLPGTLAPLLFTFIFERDSGKWGGPLETAGKLSCCTFCLTTSSMPKGTLSCLHSSRCGWFVCHDCSNLSDHASFWAI
jgi:hypothetical protein